MPFQIQSLFRLLAECVLLSRRPAQCRSCTGHGEIVHILFAPVLSLRLNPPALQTPAVLEYERAFRYGAGR